MISVAKTCAVGVYLYILLIK